MSGRLVVLIRKYTVCGLLLVTCLGCPHTFSKVVNTMVHAPLISVKSLYIVNLVVVMNIHEIFAAGTNQ